MIDVTEKNFEATIEAALLATPSATKATGPFVPGGYPVQLEAVKLLAGLGGDVNQVNTMGLAAVHGAAFRWSDDVITYLVERGARLDIKDAVGRDAHTWAAGVTIPSTPPEPSPRTMALIKKLIGEGKGIGRKTF